MENSKFFNILGWVAMAASIGEGPRYFGNKEG